MFLFIQCHSSLSYAGLFLTFLLVSPLCFSAFIDVGSRYLHPGSHSFLSSLVSSENGGSNHPGIYLPRISGRSDAVLHRPWQPRLSVQHAHERQGLENCTFALKPLSLLVKSSGPQHYPAHRCFISGHNDEFFQPEVVTHVTFDLSNMMTILLETRSIKVSFFDITGSVLWDLTAVIHLSYVYMWLLSSFSDIQHLDYFLHHSSFHLTLNF